MKVSLNWLNDYVDLSDQSVKEVAHLLTMLGLEVEAVEYPDDYRNVVVGRIESVEDIPRSKNKKCVADIGGEKITVVCGAPNVRAGVLAPVVTLGGTLPGAIEVKKIKIAGVESTGMICSEAELGLGADQSGIWILDDESLDFDFQIGDDLRKYFPADAVFKLEITHNRPDCLGHIGVARELAARLNRELKQPEFELIEEGTPAAEIASVEILDADKCPRYGGRVITGTEVKPSPSWMRSRLFAVGMRPISNIVDVTNYVMMEYGHPLHAFDLKMVAGKKIVVKTAGDGDKFTTLDEKEHKLTTDDLLICDGEKGVALAGVMGGLNSEIKDDTSDILLECAYFSPVGVRKTAKKLGITSDSSYRFERGVDPNGVPRVIDRTAYLIRETAGGKIHPGIVDNYARKIAPVTISLRPERVNFVLGGEIPADSSAEYLERLKLQVSSTDSELQVTVPTFRPDLTTEIDLIEEIARIDGYDNIEPASHSLVSLDVPPLEEEDFDSIVRTSLVAEGMQEILTHSMRHPDRTGVVKAEPLKIRVPISADFAQLRTDLFAPLLEVTGYNLNHGAESVRIFELGHVFQKAGRGNREFKQIAGVLNGRVEPVHWGSPAVNFNYFHLKGLVENFLQNISLDNYQFSSYFNNEGSFEDALAVTADGVEAGYFGRFSKQVLDRYAIDSEVFFFVFEYDLLMQKRVEKQKFSGFSRYPAMKRDLSFIFDETVTADQILAVVHAQGGEYLRPVEFFDLYRGKQLTGGRKSLSFSLQFQSDERTLTDEETDALMQQIISGVSGLGGELRQL
ncbi:MAG: phenylalanine--tRNA ligase subunit beta [FCB group bacterium]|nr:phenylalanine--tRNA ligase subunit beta [FCB group bacterium]